MGDLFVFQHSSETSVAIQFHVKIVPLTKLKIHQSNLYLNHYTNNIKKIITSAALLNYIYTPLKKITTKQYFCLNKYAKVQNVKTTDTYAPPRVMNSKRKNTKWNYTNTFIKRHTLLNIYRIHRTTLNIVVLYLPRSTARNFDSSKRRQ